ncbi:MAG TPA: hypothetical protein VMD74_01455 [Candidatus Methylomirabilis sp.]|nr:hypothetical protein [Candidatus Methylomirabilis sp.]
MHLRVQKIDTDSLNHANGKLLPIVLENEISVEAKIFDREDKGEGSLWVTSSIENVLNGQGEVGPGDRLEMFIFNQEGRTSRGFCGFANVISAK